MRIYVAIGALCLAVVGCADDSSNGGGPTGPTPITTPTATAPPPATPAAPQMVPFVVGTTASKGFQTIRVNVDGRFLGTINANVSTISGCSEIAGTQLRMMVTPGSHTLTATSDRGLTWNESFTVPTNLNSNQCWTMTLTCRNGDCSPTPTTPTPPSAPAPAPTPAPPPPTTSTPSIPPAQLVGRNASGATTTTIKNNTTYALQVTLNGPVSRSLTVPAWSSSSVTLTPGTYNETVRAIGGNVEPFSGRLSYDAGYDYIQTFTIVTR